jgi:predicted transcriptional regulator
MFGFFDGDDKEREDKFFKDIMETPEYREIFQLVLEYPGISTGNIARRTGKKMKLGGRVRRLNTIGYLKKGSTGTTNFAVCIFQGPTLDREKNMSRVYKTLNFSQIAVDKMWKAEELIPFLKKIKKKTTAEIKKMLKTKNTAVHSRLDGLEDCGILSKERKLGKDEYTYVPKYIKEIVAWHDIRAENHLKTTIQRLVGKKIPIQQIEKKARRGTITYYRITMNRKERGKLAAGGTLDFCTNPMKLYLQGGLKKPEQIVEKKEKKKE